MNTVFHEGERAVQRRAGVTTMAARVGASIGSTMPPAAQKFLLRQPMIVVGASDGAGRVWASLLSGKPGFVQALNDETVQIPQALLAGDPLESVWQAGTPVGLLAIEPATRRRMRVNGWLADGPNGLVLSVHEAYANCPKYIQAREWTSEPVLTTASRNVSLGVALTEAQQHTITEADTFFIATRHPVAGADASHRGGNPGFVQVRDANTLLFPDYSGNNMFNTLGNLQSDPRAGLLFIDYAAGATLQVTGTAAVLWDASTIAAFPGAQRVVEFRISSVVTIDNALPLRWRFIDASPFNPK